MPPIPDWDCLAGAELQCLPGETCVLHFTMVPTTSLSPGWELNVCYMYAAVP